MEPNLGMGPAIAILLALLFGYIECAFQLDSLKSNQLVHLFMGRNITLQFDIQQPNQTVQELFTIRHRRDQIFRLSTSTIQNIILLEFRLKNGRHKLFKIGSPFLRFHDQFHKIMFVLDDRRLSMTQNCQLLFSNVDNELEFGDYPFHELNAVLGSQGQGELNLREFSADPAIQLENRCPHLETLIGNQVMAEYSSATSNNEPPPVLPQQSNSVVGDDLEEALLHQRVQFLEQQLVHWNKLFSRFEGRIKRVELHQRGCTNLHGQSMSPGQRFQNVSNCTECQCGLDGNLLCRPIGCPRLDCEHPIHVEGKCCPECGKRCLYSGKFYESGQTFWPKQCTHCLCNNGNVQCGFRFPQHCPALDCPEHETLPNQCCPVCVNVDHCASGKNPCSADATCHSGRHSAICRCKEGFFGNGTKCYDVDECLWDQDARKQLGGCGDGTVCINLPGTFKCECLPGYQKMDERNCLDVIRI